MFLVYFIGSYLLWATVIIGICLVLFKHDQKKINAPKFLKRTDLLGMKREQIEKALGKYEHINENPQTYRWEYHDIGSEVKSYIVFEAEFDNNNTCIRIVRNIYSADPSLKSENADQLILKMEETLKRYKVAVIAALVIFAGILVFLGFNIKNSMFENFADLIEEDIKAGNRDSLFIKNDYSFNSIYGINCEYVENDNYDRVILLCEYEYQTISSEIINDDFYAVYQLETLFNGRYIMLLNGDIDDIKVSSCYNDPKENGIECYE